MSLAIDRFAFLRGDFKGRSHPIRPPWSIPEHQFQTICNNCGDCVKVCPTQVITTGRGQFPQIDFSRGECIFCGECVNSCLTGALTNNNIAWAIKAEIDTSACVSFHQIECRSCEDNCETRSIRFSVTKGQVSQPQINSNSCTGCGACYATCPVNAIKMINIT